MGLVVIFVSQFLFYSWLATGGAVFILKYDVRWIFLKQHIYELDEYYK